jgi:hypothetical protein
MKQLYHIKAIAWLLLAILCVVFASAALGQLVRNVRQATTQVAVGDVWEYTPYSHSDDPFKDHRVFARYKVLDIKDGYVLYQDVDRGSKDSCTLRWFMIDAHKIK